MRKSLLHVLAFLCLSTTFSFADCGSVPNNLNNLLFLGEYNGSKYYCSDDNYNNWNEAMATNAATQFGGHLVVINSAGENEFLRQGIMSDAIWIGLSDHLVEGNFMWVNGEPLSYTNWAYNEPNNQGFSGYNADFAVLIKSNGQWKDRNGTDDYEFVIEVPCPNTNTQPTCTGEITDLVFHNINGGNDMPLLDGETYQLSELPSGFNIEALIGGNAESVRFYMSGAHNQNHTENVTPYRFVGDNNALSLGVGSYTLQVKAFSDNYNSGDVCDETTVHFTIANDPVTCDATCNRGVSATTACSGNGPYTIWLANGQGGNMFDGAGETWEECANGTIHYFGTAQKTMGSTNDGYVEFDLYFSGKTTVAPPNSPKPNACAPYDESTFTYYTSTTGTITSPNHGVLNVVQTGPVFQLGEGANQQQGGFGASGWMVFTGGSGYYSNGDVNVMLSENCGGCADDDGDGVCNADDCRPNNAFYPADPGTPCDDNNSNTTNDVVQANGCSCAGMLPTFALLPEQFETCLLETVCGDVSENDAVPNNAIYELVSGPSSGSMSLSPEGNFCYVPAVDVTDEFTYEVCVTTNDDTGPEECNGKIYIMTVQYVGQENNMSIYVEGKHDGPIIATFDGVNSGDILYIDATGMLSGSAATEWHFYVNNSLDAQIHTSCSIDILDKTFGSFYVPAYTDGSGHINSVFTEVCKTATATIVVESCDPCFGLGGDSDNDGVCDDEDCQPDDPFYPAAPGTSCDDLNPDTDNDVVLGDRCTCEGTPVDPCIANGFDIVCEQNLNDEGWKVDGDCKIRSCEGDKVQLSVEPDGALVSWNGPNGFMATGNEILVSENAGASDAGNYIATVNNNGCIQSHTLKLIVFVKPEVDVDTNNPTCGEEDGVIKFFFNDTPGRTNIEFSIDGGATYPLNVKDNIGSAGFENLTAGTYDVKVRWGNNECPKDLGEFELEAPLDSDGDGLCDDEDCRPDDAFFPNDPGTACDDLDPMTVGDEVTADGCNCEGKFDPCAPLGGDSDNDGTCDSLDCRPNDGFYPATPGKDCDDLDPTTVDDMVTNDGCGCEGTFDPCALLGGDSDNDGTCDSLDCRPNDGFYPATPGKDCDDNDQTTVGDMVTSDGCGCEGTFDPCALLGGDSDQDGTCDSLDCRPNDAFYPAMPGATCDDLDPTTLNDMVTSDGCGCEGTFDPCALLGGDSDQDGICDSLDCRPNDGFYPATPGKDCDDLDPTTVDDMVTSDGCGCEGTFDPCALLGGDSDQDGTCDSLDCRPNDGFYPATPGDQCDDLDPMTLNDMVASDGCGCEGTFDPCALLGGDSDQDGTCDSLDCRPNDAFYPAMPGATCDDLDPMTLNDMVTSDGCGCEGTFDPCALLGGDSDDDGVCDSLDCRPNDAFYPAMPGATCDDGDPNTELDVVMNDSCTCTGVQVTVCQNVEIGGFIGFEGCLGDYLYCPITNPIVPEIVNCGDPEGGAGDLEIVWLQSNTSCLPPTTTFDNIANDPHWSVVPGATDLTYQPLNVNQNTCYLRCVRRDGCDTYIESNIISLTIDVNCLTFDRFGVSIGDRVWDDLNGNGIQDLNEPGLPFVYVNLQDGNGNSLQWVNTDANGDYIFFGLYAGTYQLQFSTPAGYEVTLPAAIADPEMDSDIFPLNGLTPIYTLHEGDHVRDIDAGYRVSGMFLAANGTDFQFEVVKEEEHTELFWAHNASEEVAEYIIERSANGAGYQEITMQFSKGGTDIELYTDFDLEPVTGDNLYRVKLIHTDGTVAYSTPINVHFADLVDFSVFPNPASDFVKINLESLVGKQVGIQLINGMGAVIQTVEIDEVYSKYYQIDLRDLKEGLYSIFVQSPNHKAMATKLMIAKPR